jgi:hypothetical protein
MEKQRQLEQIKKEEERINKEIEENEKKFKNRPKKESKVEYKEVDSYEIEIDQQDFKNFKNKNINFGVFDDDVKFKTVERNTKIDVEIENNISLEKSKNDKKKVVLKYDSDEEVVEEKKVETKIPDSTEMNVEKKKVRRSILDRNGFLFFIIS